MAQHSTVSVTSVKDELGLVGKNLLGQKQLQQKRKRINEWTSWTKRPDGKRERVCKREEEWEGGRREKKKKDM